MHKTTPYELNTVRMMLEHHGVHGVIAGGAVRDFVLGLPTKDIDVFVSDRTSKDTLDRAFRSEATVVYEPLPFYAKDSEYDRTPSLEIEAVYQYIFRQRPVQMILLKHFPAEPAHVMERMDFGICQAVWTGGAAMISPDFIRDMQRREFSLSRCSSIGEYMRSMRRYARLTAEGERFEGWTLDTKCNRYAKEAA